MPSRSLRRRRLWVGIGLADGVARGVGDKER
jgi:hypothetical protein